jgi:Flp pilus assembly protein TadG
MVTPMIARVPQVVSALRRFAGDRRAISSVEFALVLPLMLLIYAGSVELSEALSADRKVTRVASTVADLTAQQSGVTASDVQNIFNASTAIMTPFDATGLTIQLIAVNITDTDQLVSWAVARNDTDPADGSTSPIVIPAAIATPGSQIIIARVTYQYESPFSSFMKGITGSTTYDLDHVFMMSPRLGQNVTWRS